MPANYLNAFRGPDLAGIDRAAYSNSLLKNQVVRLPQENKAQDLAIRSTEQRINAQDTALSKEQKAAAAGILAQRFAAVASSQSPKMAARQFLTDPNFAAAGKLVGLPVDQFVVSDADTDDVIRSQATDWARALGSNLGADAETWGVNPAWVEGPQGPAPMIFSNRGNTRTVPLPSGTQRYVAPVVRETPGGGIGVVDPNRASITPVVSDTAATSAAADKAGAEAWARAAAQSGVEREIDLTTKQGTLGVWRVARQGLMSALSGTTTGPISGRFPALTAGQQTADGAVAAVAPVLKQLFRSAGEGVFTDRDQQLLLDMVPTRQDLPEARTSKMQMIDAIIEAKLSSGAGWQRSFMSEAEAEAAAAAGQIQPGDRITVNGVSGVWQ